MYGTSLALTLSRIHVLVNIIELVRESSTVLTENPMSDRNRELGIQGIPKAGRLTRQPRFREIIKLGARLLPCAILSGRKTLLRSCRRTPRVLREKYCLGDAFVAMMQPTNFGDEFADRLHGARVGRIFIQ